MFKKMALKKKINTMKVQIEETEAKRSRSQSALVQAILEQKDPNDDDVEFFNKYTEEINGLREEMHLLQQELDRM